MGENGEFWRLAQESIGYDAGLMLGSVKADEEDE